jgi:hypothetical protein
MAKERFSQQSAMLVSTGIRKSEYRQCIRIAASRGDLDGLPEEQEKVLARRHQE